MPSAESGTEVQQKGLSSIFVPPIFPYFPKGYKLWMLMIIVLIPLLVTGCEKGGYFLAGPFSDSHLFLNTELDQKLKYEISTHGCFNLPPKNILEVSDIERYKKKRVQIFHELFPQGTSVKTVFNAMRASGAECRTENSDEISHARCILTKEFISGLKVLYLQGWQIHSVYLKKDSFEYLITTRGDDILDVSVNVIGCESYEIDKNLYEEFKIIKPIRKP